MEIVIKNKRIVGEFTKTILEEVDKHIDKYIQNLPINKNTPQQTTPNIMISEDKEKLIPETENLRKYLLEYSQQMHRNNFEFSLIL